MKTTTFSSTALLLLATLSVVAQTNRVGIGTTTPRAGLDVNHNDGIVATGTYGQGLTGDLPGGAGTRLMWIPRTGSFRVGSVTGTEWDEASIGGVSIAMGYQVKASGAFSLAVGTSTTASGTSSTAMGYLTTAGGDYSTAMGVNTSASGGSSTAMGTNASTNAKLGSFVIGDININPLSSSANNEFSTRFAGGYRLFSNSNMTVGVQVVPGGNAWVTISDSTKKEAFRPADGFSFLKKIAGMRLGSWNYRGQDPGTFRHYGPMAQDFFAAFGHDGLGTIGEKTTINQADFDGVNLIAIQALIQEVETLKAGNAALKTENHALNRETTLLRADVDSIKRLLWATSGK